jgi:predicted membrane channel-forming protein YqfA (hemolysin III family)
MKLGPNTAVFAIFFLLSLFEALSNKDWLYAGIFIALGVMSLFADNPFKK